jgi:hypothetical protein
VIRILLAVLHSFSSAAGIKIILMLGVGLLLGGVVPAQGVWIVTALFLLSLTARGLLKLRSQPQFERDLDEFEASEGWRPLPAEVDRVAAERRDEILKILTWWLALPCLLFGVWAWFEPVIDWYHTFRLPAAVIVGAGVLLLLWPDKAFRFRVRKRTIVRSSLAAAIIAATTVSLHVRHPYLIPGYPDANRVRAERVLFPPNIVAIQHHSGILTDYARDLEAAGQIQKAGDLLQLAARADNTNAELQEKFADFLKRHGRPGEDVAYRKLASDLRSGAALAVSTDEYQLDHPAPLPLLEAASPRTHAIVLVADRETPPELLDILGSVLGRELGVQVYRHPQAVDITGTTRSSGLIVRQVHIEEAWKEVAAQLPPPPWGCHQYLVVTKRDIFAEGANFLYSAPTAFGSAIVSYNRLGNANTPVSDRKLQDTLCKQSLSTVIKSLGVYPSSDPRDVTAYVNGAIQLARKGRRPLPATLTAYQQQVLRWETAVKAGKK